MAVRLPAILAFATLLCASHVAPAAADLTDTERRWLDGATPPLSWAIRQGMTLTDRIVAVEFGIKLTEGTPGQVREDPAVRAAYLGVEH